VADVLRGRRLVLVGGVVVLAVASPLAFTLGSAEVGNALSASIIAATAVAALAVPLWPSQSPEPEGGALVGGGAAAVGTGRAHAEGGGQANTGVCSQSSGGALRAERTGPAIAHGPGSRANSGVEDVS
jgi:hypothetical protein